LPSQKLLLIALFFILFSTLPFATAQNSYSIQIGTHGDDASRGNLGVSVEIRTHVNPLASQDQSDSFWVGSNLQGGGFIQFGYELVTSGYYCLYGEEIGDHTNCQGSYGTIGGSDANWFWEYWPNANTIDFYYGLGTSNSSGPESAWHLYQILPSVGNGWSFILDGQLVSSLNSVQWTKSKDPVYAVAEEVSSISSTSGSLGPVEFRNLSYHSLDGWHQVGDLQAISGCGGLTPNCGITIPYGVTMLGANDFIAGTGETPRKDHELLWTQGQPLQTHSYFLTLAVPSSVQGVVDGATHNSEDANLSLPAGPHWVTVPEFIQIDKTHRLEFTHWSDGSTDLNRMIDLSSDTSLQASFIQQNMLEINSPLPATGEGWFDKGNSAFFSTDASTRLTNTLGIMIFRGWYDEAGNLVTYAGTGSIVMDHSHSLEARWTRLDYAIPIAVLLLFSSVVIGIHRHNVSKRTPTSKSNSISQENGPFTVYFSPDRREIPHPPLTTCRFCGGQLTRNGRRCSECGISTSLGYMGE
jgi:hypothetical protein